MTDDPRPVLLVDVYLNVTGTATGGSVVTGTGITLGGPPPSPRGVLSRLAGGAVIEVQKADNSWFEVTCTITNARAGWGSSKADGILSQAEGASLELEVYDPDRQLDPSNQNGPLYAVLRPGTPMRFSYNDGAVVHRIKTVRIDTITHTLTTAAGHITGNDWVSYLSNYSITLAAQPTDTLHSRALQVLQMTNASAYGLTVETDAGIPVATDGTDILQAASGWWHIAEAAKDALQFAWIDNNNVVRFRPATTAQVPGIMLGLRGPIPLDLVVQIDQDRILNLVTANSVLAGPASDLDDASITLYGTKSLLRDGVRRLPDDRGGFSAGAWVQSVLNDRKAPTVQVLPLQIWPATPAELVSMIDARGMDFVQIQFDVPAPAIDIMGRLAGFVYEVNSDGWACTAVVWVIEQ